MELRTNLARRLARRALMDEEQIHNARDLLLTAAQIDAFVRTMADAP